MAKPMRALSASSSKVRPFRYVRAAFLAVFAALTTLLPLGPAAAQSLTLTNLRPVIAPLCPRAGAVTTIAALFRELAACAPKPPEPAFPQAPAPDVPASFTVAQGTVPSWGNGAISGIYNIHEGAFRFVCSGDGPLANDDPVIYFGKPGAAHLHHVWGNRLFDASLTPERLLASASTNCNDTPFSFNRSSYWMPALVHDSGEVIRPDLISVYYKRKTRASPFCQPGNIAFMGECEALPNRIKFVFGWDQLRPTAKVRGASWYCTGGSGGHFPDLDTVFQSGCKAGDLLIANTIAPNCWNGRDLDSTDHRSHMAYGDYGDDGRPRCPATHPKLIPQQENKAQWTVTADMIGTRPDGTKYSRIRLSSDHMLPGGKPGQTLHADYMEAWLEQGKRAWHDACIEKALNCSGGDLGNGRQLIGAGQPKYGWVHPSPRVAAPTHHN